MARFCPLCRDTLNMICKSKKEKPDMNIAREDTKETPMQLALKNKDDVMIAILVENGADIETKSKDTGLSALMYFSEKYQRLAEEKPSEAVLQDKLSEDKAKIKTHIELIISKGGKLDERFPLRKESPRDILSNFEDFQDILKDIPSTSPKVEKKMLEKEGKKS